jgi:hypothetical protein
MTIDERIEKLEQGLTRARRTNAGLLIILCLGVAAMISGAAVEEKKTEVAKMIRAQKIMLEDEKGRPRLFLNGTGEEPGLSLADETGVVRANLLMFMEEPSLVLRDNKGMKRLQAGLTGEGPRIWLNDEKGNTRLSQVVEKEGSGLLVFDDNDKNRIGLFLKKTGPFLEMCDEKEAPRVSLGICSTKTPDGAVTSFPESTLLLFGPDRKVTFQAPR